MSKRTMRVYFIRHGQTAKAATDAERELTPEGINQAKRRRESLGLNERFQLVLRSPMKRAEQTADILGPHINHEFSRDPYILNELYMPTDKTESGKVLWGAAKTIPQPHTLRAFAEVKPILEVLADCAICAINDIISRYGIDDDHILIIGHAVLLQNVGYRYNREVCAKLLDANIGECEGFILTVEVEDSNVTVVGCDLIKDPAPAPAQA